MRDPLIDLLTVDDLDAAFALSTSAGWNQLRDDWLVLLHLAPSASFAARIDRGVVGTAIAIDYGGFGWIAMMLVDPRHRGRGIGGRLLEAALDAIRPQVPVRLDATPLGRPLYERYGFKEETTLTRHVRDASVSRAVHDDEPGGWSDDSLVRPMTLEHIDLIADRDHTVFGGNRRAVLESMPRTTPRYCYVAAEDSASMHYCLGRYGRLFDQIGPVVAPNPAGAQALVRAALAAAGDRSVMLDVFDTQPEFTAWLADRGFSAQRPLFRMCRGTRSVAPADLREFAILGPEFG